MGNASFIIQIFGALRIIVRITLDLCEGKDARVDIAYELFIVRGN